MPVAGPGLPRSAVWMRVAGMAVALALLAGGAAGLVVQFFTQERTETMVVTAPVTRVVARTDAGWIKVRRGESGSPVTVTRTLRWAFREPRTSIVTGGGLLTVTGGCERQPRPGVCTTDLELRLPADVALDLTTVTGDVQATVTNGARATGTATGVAPVVARSRAGNISLTAPGATSVEARTDLGNITVTGGGTGVRIQARTEIGNVVLKLAEPPAAVRARAQTGNIDVTVPAGTPYHVVTDTATGKPHVTVPVDDAVPRLIDASTDTGTVTVQAA